VIHNFAFYGKRQVARKYVAKRKDKSTNRLWKLVSAS
jgi:hypothetical protein